MKNMIEELYYGNIDPQGCGYRPNSSVKRASDAVTGLEEELLKSLDGEDKDLFLRFCNAYSEFLGESELETFITGFRLGAHFVFDTFVSVNSSVSNLYLDSNSSGINRHYFSIDNYNTQAYNGIR